jgi:8-oxo-dGTP pyrophosphatase MutT (NUDIX family)
MPRVISSVKALINNRETYLFLREPVHHGDIWDLPGGKIEYGEEPEQALIREVKEEVNIDITVDKSIGVWWFYSRNSKHQVICHTFLCNLVNGINIDLTKNPADEHFIEYRWLSFEDVLHDPKIKLTDSLRTLLLSVNRTHI